MLTLKDIVSDWVRDTYIIPYPIQCTEDVIRVYGYRSVDIENTQIVCHWWTWDSRNIMVESTIHSADPEFFDKLQEFIEWRLRIG